MEKRKCKVCLQSKDHSEFYSTYSYVRYSCKKCEYKRMHEWRMKRGKENKLKAVEYLGGKCSRCPYKKCIQALELHHLDPSTKEAAPAKIFYQISDWKRILKEVEKCILLCSNCHREETFKDL